MKTLITGGAGFIGSHLAEKLLEKGDAVFVLDDLSTGSLKNIAHLRKKQKFHFQKGSVLDEKLVNRLVRRVDRVFHLAAVVGVKRVAAEPLKTIEVNLRGTENILAAANRFGRKKVFIASSSEVYGKSQKLPFEEGDDCLYGSNQDSRWIYPLTKSIDELLALAYFQEKKLPVVIARFFNVAGPRQSAAYGMVIPNFIQNALKNKPIPVFGSGKQTRSFIHIDDAVAAIIALMEIKKAEGEIINLGNDEEISIYQLAKKVIKLSKSKSKIQLVPFSKTYDPSSIYFQRRRPELKKIKHFFKLKNKSLDEIILDVKNYYQQP